MKQDNTATLHFFWGLRLAGAEEMQPVREASKVFSKKVGLFLANDTSERFEDIMHDIINSTKKSDFSDFLLGLSEKDCDTGMRGKVSPSKIGNHSHYGLPFSRKRVKKP